jgi:4-amino-4-deoxy-L-arabinose transferase-like glycosyltransferase
MSRTPFRALVAGAFGLYALLHLVIIGRSHIPWFDDTFFASIADTLRRTGEFRLAVSPLWLDKPVYLYGPVYFLAVAASFASLGFGVLQYRLTGLVAALALLAVAYRILRREGIERGIALAVCVLMALDPILLEVLRIGRMDLMAVLFCLLAYLMLLDSRSAAGRAALLYAIASGVFGSLAVLTTPRPGYVMIPLGLILLFRCRTGPLGARFAQLVAWGIGFAPLCIAWIAWAFGGIGQMLAYFGEFADTYAGAGLATVSIQKPLLVILLGLTILKLAREPRLLVTELTVFLGLGILLFFLFVKNKGTFGGGYSILLVPFEYMAVGWLVARCPPVSGRRAIQATVFVLLFLLNGGAFLSIVASDLLLWPSLDPATAQQVIKETIPAGSKVVGDDKYFFLVTRAASDFQYLERGGTVAERLAYQRDTYGFDYLVTALDDRSEIMSAYLAGTDLVKVATIDAPAMNPLARYPLFARSKFMLWVFTLDYGGTVYRRRR